MAVLAVLAAQLEVHLAQGSLVFFLAALLGKFITLVSADNAEQLLTKLLQLAYRDVSVYYLVYYLLSSVNYLG